MYEERLLYHFSSQTSQLLEPLGMVAISAHAGVISLPLGKQYTLCVSGCCLSKRWALRRPEN